MEARFRSWWQYIRKHRVAAIIIAFVVVIVFIFAGYWFDWTGFNGYTVIWLPKVTNGTSQPITRLEEQQPAKALWDWLQLLFIPAILTLGAVWLTTRQNHDREISLDNQREAALQAYIDKMSELLLEKHLGELTADGKSKPEYEQVRNIAQVRTFTALRVLDSNRKRILLQFLNDSRLINKANPLISLREADLSGANFSQADLRRVNLKFANLGNANLSGAQLDGAMLGGANLIGADLRKANLKESALSQANLTEANLSDADLTGAYLASTNLSRVNLSEANLSGAHLQDAIGVTVEEMEKQAKSLKGATMPDGSKYP